MGTLTTTLPDLATGRWTLTDHVLAALPYRREVPLADVVAQVEATAGCGFAAAYRVLRRLTDAGLVSRRRDGVRWLVQWVPDPLTKELPDD